MIKTKIIADSIYTDYATGKEHRVTTFELEYPRYIHSELLTHRVFSRNAASSRAIPLDRMIDLVIDNPVVPKWTLNQKGMAGNESVDTYTTALATAEWIDARDYVIKKVNKLKELGIHKQNANRLLEPFQHIKTILTGTDFENFFHLRISPEAQPEIRELAADMKDAYMSHMPNILYPQDIHCPYFNKPVKRDNLADILISTALCAQVSYRRENVDPEVVERIINRLIATDRIHASPFEHVCAPNYVGENQRGNLTGFIQLRHKIEDIKPNIDAIIKFNNTTDYYKELINFGSIIWL